MTTEIQLILPSIADGEDKSSPLANRIRKNYKHLKKWAKRTFTDAFRIYDRELPLYPLSIDFYAGRFCIYYYAANRKDPEPSLEITQEVLDALKTIFNAQPKDIFWKTRQKSKETRQYEKISESQEFFIVTEFGIKFLVNLIDYLDTGLFLDHRETRKLVSSDAKGKKVLNLFAYTCAFSIHAAAAGASFTKSVDMSNTYCAWGRNNFSINNLPSKTNLIIRADCLKFLKEEIFSGIKYDIVIIDPPTISRSKKMDQLFDIQVDYVFLISQALKLLAPNGAIYFSTNFRKFHFDEKLFPDCSISDISQKTHPCDFRDTNIHKCWKIVI